MNKCLNCTAMSQVIFDSGREWRWCKKFNFALKEPVTYCTAYEQRDALPGVDNWQLMEYIKTIEPYIIEFKGKAGFKGNEVIIRPATKEDKTYLD